MVTLMPRQWTTFFAAAVLVAATAVVGSAQQEPSQFLKEKLTRAEQGDAEAQYELGIIYEHGGFGVPQDYAEAVRWFGAGRRGDL